MAGLPQAAFAEMLTPRVVVTVEPLKPYVDEILKGITESQSLLRSGQDPHAAALSASQALAIRNADIIILPSEGMSPVLARIIAQKKKEGTKVIELLTLKGADPQPYPRENPWLAARKKASKKKGHDAHEHKDEHADDEETHEHEHEHEHEEEADMRDPHIWLDPLRMAAIAVPLAEAMGEAATPHRRAFTANAHILARHLRTEVDPAIRAMVKKRTERLKLSSKPFVPFLTYHAAYQYFLARYRLDAAGFISDRPMEYMGAATLHQTLQEAEDIELGCLISEADTGFVRRIAESAGGRVVALNPDRSYGTEEVGLIPWAKNDHERLLYKVAESFAGCL